LATIIASLGIAILPVNAKYTPPPNPSKPKETGANTTRAKPENQDSNPLNSFNFTPFCAPNCPPKEQPKGNNFNFANTDNQKAFQPGFNNLSAKPKDEFGNSGDLGRSKDTRKAEKKFEKKFPAKKK
jgi:hypothetical protein